MSNRKKRAVIVEDSGQMRELIQLALTAAGFTDIIKAGNGAEALALLKEADADIIVMDWMMDVMDGLECTRQIRAGRDGIDPKISIILLTSMVSKESENAAYAAGADLFMAKPFSLKQLNAGITKVIGRNP